MTFKRRARTKQLEAVSFQADGTENFKTYYARGKLRFISFMTSAIQMVAERDTPTRQ